nr:MAG TPA: hypothetical protein [Caudoviricetes sp.]
MENSRKGRNLRSVALFLAMLIITPLLILGCSCAKTAANNTVYRDSAHTSLRRDSVSHRQIHWQDTRQHDSIFKQDSVLVYINGDTIIKERWHNLTTTRWRTTTKTDTIVGDIYTFVTDTVKVKYYVNRYKTKEVEKPASTCQKIRLFAGDCILLFLAIFAVCWIKKRIKKRVQ